MNRLDSLSEGSMSLVHVYTAMLAKHISLHLAKNNAEGTHIVQSVIHRDDSVDGLHLVSISDGNGSDTCMVALTERELIKAGHRFQRLKDADELPRLSTICLKLPIDLKEEEDYYSDDCKITDEKLLSRYTFWDFIRLSFMSFMR